MYTYIYIYIYIHIYVYTYVPRTVAASRAVWRPSRHICVYVYIKNKKRNIKKRRKKRKNK